MKLKKKTLLKNVTPFLEKMGYTSFKTDLSGLFIKYLGDGIFLSLVLNISQLYDDLFRANYYIAPHTQVNLGGSETPKGYFQYISDNLTKEENEQFGEEWSGYDQIELDNFFKAVQHSEPRIIAQKPLIIGKIIQSELHQGICRIHSAIIEEVKNPVLTEQPKYYEYFSKKKAVPIEWYIASDKVQQHLKYKYYTKWNVVGRGESAYQECMLRMD